MAGHKGSTWARPCGPSCFPGKREEGLRRFGLKDDRPVLMVVGAPPGPRPSTGRCAPPCPSCWSAFRCSTCAARATWTCPWRARPGTARGNTSPDEMPDAYAAADILVSRAGSNTLSEILASTSLPCSSPIPRRPAGATRSSTPNPLSSGGLARVLYQEDMTPEVLLRRVVEVYRERASSSTPWKRSPPPTAGQRTQIHQPIREKSLSAMAGTRQRSRPFPRENSAAAPLPAAPWEPGRGVPGEMVERWEGCIGFFWWRTTR